MVFDTTKSAKQEQDWIEKYRAALALTPAPSRLAQLRSAMRDAWRTLPAGIKRIFGTRKTQILTHMPSSDFPEASNDASKTAPIMTQRKQVSH